MHSQEEMTIGIYFNTSSKVTCVKHIRSSGDSLRDPKCPDLVQLYSVMSLKKMDYIIYTPQVLYTLVAAIYCSFLANMVTQKSILLKSKNLPFHFEFL
mgnify:CR=1 FL=1